MHPDLERLIRLQKLDTEIHRKESLLASLPAQIEAVRAALTTAEGALAAFDGKVTGQAKRKRELEGEIEMLKGRINDDKVKLPQLKTNVEYRALTKEIEGYEYKIREIEDDLLEMMEGDEQTSEQRQPLVARVEEEKAGFAQAAAEKEAAIEEVKKLITGLRGERASLIDGVSTSVFNQYERILAARDGMGVAPVKDMICLGCHQAIAPQLFYNIRDTDVLHTCPHCSRYLYYLAAQEQEQSA